MSRWVVTPLITNYPHIIAFHRDNSIVPSLVPRLLWGQRKKEPGTHCWRMCELCRRIDRKIIQIILMTTCWLYGYIISSILRSIYEREREMASLGIASGELKTKFTAAQIFLCSLQFLRNTIMATKFGSLNTSGGTNGEFPDSNILWLQMNKSGMNWLLTLCAIYSFVLF